MKINFPEELGGGVGGLCHTCGNYGGVKGSSAPHKKGKSREVAVKIIYLAPCERQ